MRANQIRIRHYQDNLPLIIADENNLKATVEEIRRLMSEEDLAAIKRKWLERIKSAKCILCGSSSQGSHNTPKGILKLLEYSDRERTLVEMSNNISFRVENYLTDYTLDNPFPVVAAGDANLFYSLCNKHDRINTRFESMWTKEKSYELSKAELSTLAARSLLYSVEQLYLLIILGEHRYLGSGVQSKRLNALRRKAKSYEETAKRLLQGELLSERVLEIDCDLKLAANSHRFISKKKSERLGRKHYVISVLPTGKGFSKMIVHSWHRGTIQWMNIHKETTDLSIANLVDQVFRSQSGSWIVPKNSYLFQDKLFNTRLRGLDKGEFLVNGKPLSPEVIFDLLSYEEPKVSYSIKELSKSPYRDLYKTAAILLPSCRLTKSPQPPL